VVIGALVVLGLLKLGDAFVMRHKKQQSITGEPCSIYFEALAGKSLVNELSDTRTM
jgi:hypothetical protein